MLDRSGVRWCSVAVPDRPTVIAGASEFTVTVAVFGLPSVVDGSKRARTLQVSPAPSVWDAQSLDCPVSSSKLPSVSPLFTTFEIVTGSSPELVIVDSSGSDGPWLMSWVKVSPAGLRVSRRWVAWPVRSAVRSGTPAVEDEIVSVADLSADGVTEDGSKTIVTSQLWPAPSVVGLTPALHSLPPACCWKSPESVPLISMALKVIGSVPVFVTVT